MALRWWIGFLLTLSLTSVTLCQHRNVEVRSRVGGQVDLSCSFSTYGPITWKKNHDIVAVGTNIIARDHRIRMKDHRTLSIYPVSQQDEATYACSNHDASLEQRFYLRIVDDHQPSYPSPPSHPSPPSDHSSALCYRMEETMNKRSREILEHLQQIEQRVEILKSQQDRVEGYVRRLGDGSVWQRPTAKTDAPLRPTPPRPTRQTPPTYYPESSIARTTYVNGQLVHEYIWLIRDFDLEMYRSERNPEHLIKGYFLTAVPGYNMTVRVYPNKNHKGYISIYAGVAPGAHDRIVSWPFRQDFELAIVSHSTDERDVVRTVSPTQTTCPNAAFERKNRETGDSCGYEAFLDVNEYNRKKYAYLNNGYLYVRIRVHEY